jgi:hypothetical protein
MFYHLVDFFNQDGLRGGATEVRRASAYKLVEICNDESTRFAIRAHGWLPKIISAIADLVRTANVAGVFTSRLLLTNDECFSGRLWRSHHLFFFCSVIIILV